MNKQIAIVDYCLGNILSAQQSFLKVSQTNNIKANILITNNPETIKKSTHVVLPGQGAFDSCMNGLTNIPGMLDALNHFTLIQRKPFLGICLGAQILAKYLGCDVIKNKNDLAEIIIDSSGVVPEKLVDQIYHKVKEIGYV